MQESDDVRPTDYEMLFDWLRVMRWILICGFIVILSFLLTSVIASMIAGAITAHITQWYLVNDLKQLRESIRARNAP